ncbi:hypothetical protein A2U01_0064987, partial [Trifolium medium]|nr:hypothetical protein [Trifolium medium]
SIRVSEWRLSKLYMGEDVGRHYVGMRPVRM